MPTDKGAGHIGPHVAEFGHNDEPEDIKMSSHMAFAVPRQKKDNFGHKAEKPGYIEQPENGIGHGLQGRNVPSDLEHLPRKNHEHAEKQRRDLEVITSYP